MLSDNSNTADSFLLVSPIVGTKVNVEKLKGVHHSPSLRYIELPKILTFISLGNRPGPIGTMLTLTATSFKYQGTVAILTLATFSLDLST